MRYTIKAIATAHSPYKRKFGITHQPGLIPAAEVCIRLDFRFTVDSIRGLESSEYVRISLTLHSVIGEGWSSLIRPLHLGGRQRMGVFATRSPHRPDHMGLSLLELERVETGRPVKIYYSGMDLLDGTLIMDTKPYIPFTGSKPDARSGSTAEEPE